jgi:hypothetical protein
MFADPLDILCGDLLAVSDSLLNEIGGILGLVVIPKFHTQHLRMQYEVIIPYIVQKHNTKQQNYEENFDKKISPVKALRLVDYLSTVKLPVLMGGQRSALAEV